MLRLQRLLVRVLIEGILVLRKVLSIALVRPWSICMQVRTGTCHLPLFSLHTRRHEAV